MIKSVQKATKILSVLRLKSPAAVTLAEISQKTQFNKSTCSHIISTLENEGFVVKSPGRGYILGPEIYCLAGGDRYKSDLITICRPIMRYLYKNLGYCIVLAIIENSTKYVIDSIDDGVFYDRNMRIKEDNIYSTATGRAIMQNMSDEEICGIYQKYGAPSESGQADINSLEKLLEELRSAKKCEIITTRNKAEDRIYVGYGAPIFDAGGCVGAIGVAVNILQSEKAGFKDEEKIKTYLSKAVKEINRRLTYK